MPITIRLGTEADAERLPAIERSAADAFRALPDLAWVVTHGVTPVEDHLSFIRQGAEWIAERAAEGPVGFVCTERCDGVLHVHELAVRHDRQRRGAGRALMETVTQAARDEGLTAVTLNTFRDVAWNAPFYAQLGFEVLEPDQLDARLTELVRRETARGLPAERRCVMRLALA